MIRQVVIQTLMIPVKKLKGNQEKKDSKGYLHFLLVEITIYSRVI